MCRNTDITVSPSTWRPVAICYCLKLVGDSIHCMSRKPRGIVVCVCGGGFSVFPLGSSHLVLGAWPKPLHFYLTTRPLVSFTSFFPPFQFSFFQYGRGGGGDIYIINKGTLYALCLQVVESRFEKDTPLFLKFINMMISDATVQLDEGMDVSYTHTYTYIHTVFAGV